MSGPRFVIKKRPKAYPELPQQSLFKRALEHCGIEKGITKAELMDKMKNCIPQFFKEHKIHGD
jgi:hypothetical protein